MDHCGHNEGQTLIKHFSIEEGHKTQAEIEALVVNNAELSVDCSYYKSAFEFVAGDPSDKLGDSLTLYIDGTVTVPEDNIGIEVDNTDKIILEDFFPGEDYTGSVQVVFTGEIVGNSGDVDSVLLLSKTSFISSFERSSNALEDGGDLFVGHSNTGGKWVFSASFIDNNFEDNSVK